MTPASEQYAEIRRSLAHLKRLRVHPEDAYLHTSHIAKIEQHVAGLEAMTARNNRSLKQRGRAAGVRA